MSGAPWLCCGIGFWVRKHGLEATEVRRLWADAAPGQVLKAGLRKPQMLYVLLTLSSKPLGKMEVSGRTPHGDQEQRMCGDSVGASSLSKEHSSLSSYSVVCEF